MNRTTSELFTAPMFLATAFLLVGLAIIEKGLNLVGGSLPIVNVFPRQLLDWAVTLLMLEIALTVRLIYERGR
ncbi:MAG TPA: hypothetical protein VLA09_03720 [Longimicrobiales bacterium]|nr:hypothetical protein [Longimicrobiales bacterium]